MLRPAAVGVSLPMQTANPIVSVATWMQRNLTKFTLVMDQLAVSLAGLTEGQDTSRINALFFPHDMVNSVPYFIMYFLFFLPSGLHT